MELKRGYRQTELGVIPKDWEVRDFGQLYAEPSRNGIYKTAEFQGRGTRIVNMGEMFGFEFISDQEMNRVALTTKEIKMNGLLDGDLLFGRRSVVPAGAGKCALVVEPCEPLTFESSIIRVRLNQTETYPLYCYYFFASPTGRAAMSAIVSGTNVKGIRATELRMLKIPQPPLPEQRAIAAALSDVDGLIGGLDQLITKKRNLKQAAMQQLLTGKKRLAGFRDEWALKNVGEFTGCTSGGTPSTLHPEYWNGAIRWMSSGELNLKFVNEVEGRITAAGLANSSATMIPPKCVLIGLAGQGKTRGTVAINMIELCTNQSVAAILPNSAFVPEYLYYNLDARYDELRSLSTGDGGRGGLNLSIIKSLAVPFPKIEEQTAIAEVLLDIDAEIAALEQRRNKTHALKQGMMQALLTGRIRLVSAPANIIQLPAVKDAATETKTHNWQINEAVVISVLVKQFGKEEFPLGRKRYTKLSYLMHRHVEHVAEGYLKKAAGPYNPATKYKGPETIAIRNKYIRPHTHQQFSGFVASDNIGQAEAYFKKWYGADVLHWLEQFRYKKNDELELLATVDMAMEDLSKAGQPITLGHVKDVIHNHPEWEAKLNRPIFSDESISDAMKLCSALFK